MDPGLFQRSKDRGGRARKRERESELQTQATYACKVFVLFSVSSTQHYSTPLLCFLLHTAARESLIWQKGRLQERKGGAGSLGDNLRSYCRSKPAALAKCIHWTLFLDQLVHNDVPWPDTNRIATYTSSGAPAPAVSPRAPRLPALLCCGGRSKDAIATSNTRTLPSTSTNSSSRVIWRPLGKPL